MLQVHRWPLLVLSSSVTGLGCVEIDPEWTAAEDEGGGVTSSVDGDGDGDGDGDDDDDDDDDGETGESSGGDDDDDPVANIAFITAALFSVEELDGVAGADAHCQQAADDAGLPGTYRAWLSTEAMAARDRFADASGWVRVDGRPVAQDLTQFPSGINYAPDLDEYGSRLVAEPVWSATAEDGTATDGWESQICASWTTNDGIAGFGWSGGSGWLWAASGWGLGCGAPAHLNCFGVDIVSELEISPQEGRIAFVTDTKFAANIRRDAMDAFCQQEANLAGLDGSFIAFMAAPGEAAVDRLDLTGPPWVRVDGLPVFEPGDPMGLDLSVGVSLTAEGVLPQLDHRVWFGASAPDEPGTLEGTCDGWTTIDAGMTSTLASSMAADWMEWNAYDGTGECGQLYAVLCFEQ